MSNGKYARFNSKGHYIEYELLEASGVEKSPIVPNDSIAKFHDSTIVYKNVFPEVDLQNITFNESNKEDLVLHSYQGLHIFKFKLKTDLTAKTQPDGSIQFYNDNDKSVFVLPKPFMTDSNYSESLGETETSHNVQYELVETNDGYTLTVNADPEWLGDSKRKFPVYIDPTTSTLNTGTDTFVMSAYPTTNYGSSSSKWDANQGQYVLKTGYYDSTTGTNYAFLNTDISSVDNMIITGAKLNVHVTHSATSIANGLWLDSVSGGWNPSTVTWNTKPSSTNITYVNVVKDTWAQFDVTSTVKGWVDGTKTNYGFKLHTNGNGQSYWKKIVSSTNSTLKPYISVTYEIPVPETPTGKALSWGNGTGYVEFSWKAVPGASRYNVWIYNGKNYESFDVGNATSWSTANKKIWPTHSEINSGRFDLHQDQLGSELPIDPSPVYRNAGGTYGSRTNYAIRVSAVFPNGKESAMSGGSSVAFVPNIPNLTKPIPSGNSYSNGNETGYVDVKWDTVPNATGYKIWVFNGSYYEALDVGNVTSWSTSNKKIWPTSAEINAGRYKLHLTDNLGSELPLNPSSTYAKAGTKYATATNYWFRVTAYNSQGETVLSDPYTPYLPNLSIPNTPNGQAFRDKEGLETGNVVLEWEPIAGATGYKVAVWNGISYEYFDVGEANYWSTIEKGIWPTPEEVQTGRYKLHHDGLGAELPLSPSSTYSKAGTTYANNDNYYFRIVAYDLNGETIYSQNPLMLTIPDTTPQQDELLDQGIIYKEDITSYEEELNDNGENNAHISAVNDAAEEEITQQGFITFEDYALLQEELAPQMVQTSSTTSTSDGEDIYFTDGSVISEEEALEIEAMALEYYNYFKTNNIDPTTESVDTAVTTQAVTTTQALTVLKNMGLNYTSKQLATRLATLGILAGLDGPLPIGDFIALVAGVTIVSVDAYNYHKNRTAIKNNIGTKEGRRFSSAAARAIEYTYYTRHHVRNGYRHFVAIPRSSDGGGIYVGSPLTVKQANLRALWGQDTFSVHNNYARNVAYAPFGRGLWENAHTSNGRYPNNLPHWHALKINQYGQWVRHKGHHFYANLIDTSWYNW
ncbi:DNRLRE domain-containing protein [Bacillus sp. BGMRC 2118]|nr:DNRLRE domain-containing protein [Bacillus sp. BGMRC 2118]